MSRRAAMLPALLGAVSALFLAGGCNRQIDIHPIVDPSGGALTESEARVYEYDARGYWYVIFIRCDDLLAADHRHSPGIHAFFARNGDLLFFSRCSGRGELIDLMGRTFRLDKGAVFLCDVSAGQGHTRQLNLRIDPLRMDDPETFAKALYDLSRDPRVAAFLSPESRARLLADWKAEINRKREREAQQRAERQKKQ